MSSAEKRTSLSRAWLVVALLGIVGCLNYLDRMMIATMRQSIVEAIPLTDAQFGLLTSTFRSPITGAAEAMRALQFPPLRAASRTTGFARTLKWLHPILGDSHR